MAEEEKDEVLDKKAAKACYLQRSPMIIDRRRKLSALKNISALQL